MTERPDILVLGAGLVGLATARELAGRGLSVELLEARHAGAGASSAGAGLLSPISDWESTAPFIEICRRARDDWRGWLDELVAESGVDVEYDDSGAILVGFDAADDEGLATEARTAAAAGETWREIDVAQARDLAPDLSPRAARAVHLPGEHRVDNVATIRALVAACRSRGVRLTEGFAARKVRVGASSVVLESTDDRREAARLVLAAGAWSGAIEGIPGLPIRPVRGQMLRLGGAAWSWRGSLRHGHDYVVRRGAASLLVGATVEEAGFAAQPTADGIAGLLDFVRRVFPGLARAPIESIWAGLRPGSPDGRPLVGAIDDSPLFAACGHYRNGILLAPWTARETARAIADGGLIEAAALFAPGRFAGASG